MSLVKAQNLSKNYVAGEITVQAIRDVNFTIESGAFLSIVGPSGSGKSTLLNLIGCLDSPTSGILTVGGQDVSLLNKKKAAKFRGENIGFVFQDFNLIPVLTVYENIEYPLLMVLNWSPAKRKSRVQQLLEAIDMEDQGNKFPSQISGGQKQRVAVARALVSNAKLVLADEPTANLDKKTANRIITLMKDMREEFGTTFIFSTHDPRIVKNAEIIFNLEDGLLEQQSNGNGEINV